MVTLSREYFTKRVEEAKHRHFSLEILIQKARELGVESSAIDTMEEQEMMAWSLYRSAVVSLERFELGKMVHVEGRGYFNSYIQGK